MRAMVSPALPALTVLTASIERLGQSCARAAGAKNIRTAHATAPHHVRNDIDTSLECGRSSDRLRWSRWHDAPNRGAHATSGTPPALARRMWRHLTPAGRLRILQNGNSGRASDGPHRCLLRLRVRPTPNVGLGGRNERTSDYPIIRTDPGCDRQRHHGTERLRVLEARVPPFCLLRRRPRRVPWTRRTWRR